MKKIVLGNKDKLIKYGFRETCFGINIKLNKFLLFYDKNQYSLVGGGIDGNETHEECLKREFEEEVGYSIKNIKPLFIIDCFWLADNKYPFESLVNIYQIDLDKKINENCESNLEYIDINKSLELLNLPYQKKAIELIINKIEKR